MIKKAFTMTEALIIIGIIGVIAALSIVAVNTAKPDKDIIMFRRAYSETQKVIRELLTDKELYPKAEVLALNLNSSKLMSMAISRNCNQIQRELCSYKAEMLPPDGLTDDFGNNCGMSNNEYLRYRTNNCGGGGGGGSSLPVTSSSSSSGSSSGLSSGLSSSGTIPPLVSSGLSSGRGPIKQCTILDEEACKEKGSFYTLNDDCACVLKLPEPSSSSSGLISSGLASGAILPNPGNIACNIVFIQNCKAKKGTVTKDCKCELPNGDELTFEDSQISVLGEGFADTEITDAQKAKNPFLNLAGVGPQNKFAVSFANRLNTVSNPTISNNTVQFGTPDGLYWVIEDHFNDDSTKYAYISVHMAKISPTLSGTQLSDALSKTCGYSATCEAPNKFTFKVEPSGRVQLVQPDNKAKVDPMACSYLRYPKINKRSKIPTDHTVNNCFPKPKKPAILPPRRP